MWCECYRKTMGGTASCCKIGGRWIFRSGWPWKASTQHKTHRYDGSVMFRFVVFVVVLVVLSQPLNPVYNVQHGWAALSWAEVTALGFWILIMKKYYDYRERKDELPTMQVSFIDMICLPLYKMLSDTFPWIKPLYQGTLNNRNHWQDLAEKVEMGYVYDSCSL